VSAFRLAWQDYGGAFVPSRYGYVSHAAALTAAQKLNQVRAAKRLEPYIAIVECAGDEQKLIELPGEASCEGAKS
jgi:hypothetical protein